LASVDKLEEENSKIKSALDEANKEVTRLKKDKVNLNEKMESIARRRDDVESYLRSLAKKLFIKLEGIYSVPTGLSSSTRHTNIDSS
jgi:predicted  nucleic acid-binding Zn-ribbon protein